MLIVGYGDDGTSSTSTATPETTETTRTPSSAESTEDTTLVTAPDSERVDLAEPTFTNPTAVTNPRFPIAELEQVIQLGEEAGAALRIEVTLLPETKVIEWNGQQVETLVSQFVAYEDGQVLEVAVDFFAQADDGAVWYFGEDVANYVDGVCHELIVRPPLAQADAVGGGAASTTQWLAQIERVGIAGVAARNPSNVIRSTSAAPVGTARPQS